MRWEFLTFALGWSEQNAEVEIETIPRPGTWNFDALHSQVMVSICHFQVAKLRAKFPGVKGSLEVDAEDPLRSRLQIEIDARSVTTGHPAQEDFIRSEPWLDAQHHPSITFSSAAIEQHERDFAVRGELSFRGVKRQVEFPFEFHGVVPDPWGLRAGFTAEFGLDRRDFGITWDRVFDWGLMAGHELNFHLDIELVYPDESLAQMPRGG